MRTCLEGIVEITQDDSETWLEADPAKEFQSRNLHGQGPYDGMSKA